MNMNIYIALISIFAIAGFVTLCRNLIKKFAGISVCPICSGVLLTWLWIFAGTIFGLLDIGSWKIILAMLMGGSVVGVSGQIEKRLTDAVRLLWKFFFIPLGFLAVWSILSGEWILAIGELAIMFFFAVWAFWRGEALTGDSESVRKLRESMKNCC